jgi:hypothetical protein
MTCVMSLSGNDYGQGRSRKGRIHMTQVPDGRLLVSACENVDKVSVLICISH